MGNREGDKAKESKGNQNRAKRKPGHPPFFFLSEASRCRVHASLARRLPNCLSGFAWFSSEAPSRVVGVSEQRLVIGGCGANPAAAAGMFEVALHNGRVLNARLGSTLRQPPCLFADERVKPDHQPGWPVEAWMG